MLSDVLTHETISELAGSPVVARGSAYFAENRVQGLTVSDTRADATVRGSLPYQVTLVLVRGRLEARCSCPAAEDGSFCKHCVAVALAIASDPKRPIAARARRSKSRTDPREQLVRYVQSLAHDELVELVIAQVDADWRLRERLVARAAAAIGSGIDGQAWRKRLDSVFAPYDDFVSYREAAGWAAEVSDVLDSLAELVDTGHASDVVELAEYAHRRAEEATQYIDDSDGWLTDISQRIGDIHHHSCEVGNADHVALARRLADLELSSEVDTFHRAAVTYADVLGTDGLAEYRRVIEPRWRKLGPARDSWSSERFRLNEAMTGVALAGGDPDDLILIKRNDLRAPDSYVEIAQTLRDSGRPDEAIDWSRRGLDDFIDRPWQIGTLCELLAHLLRARGDAEGAVDVYRRVFEHNPSLAAYRRLLDESTVNGSSDDERRRAIATLHAHVAASSGTDHHDRPMRPAPASALVEILLYEGDVSGAWTVACEHGVSTQLWLTLARAREATDPLDSIPIYGRETRMLIDTRKNDGYKRAVDLMARVRSLAGRANQPELFDQLLTEVRTDHKAKRNLMALLHQRGW